MNPINLSNFLLITSKYGSEQGATHFDKEEDLIHDIFPDRIIFNTNYVDETSYETYFEGEVLCIKKTKLDDYELHEDAEVIADELDEDDLEELEELWNRMEQDLITAANLHQLNIRSELTALYSTIFTDTEAVLLSKKLPQEIAPQVEQIWEHLDFALNEVNRSVSFEWKEWSEVGVMELNDLALLEQLKVKLPYPNQKEIEALSNEDNWEEAILQYFNHHLKGYDMKLIAIGTHFDEYQTFACLTVSEDKFSHALEIIKKLGLVYKR